jgi:hypothetical protein
MTTLLRIVGAIFVISVGASLAAYALNRDRRWLRFAWQLCRFGLLTALIILALYALERVVAIL